jgi:splicing factor 3A subunit 1
MVIGIIRPPPEIRAVADKTALFVSKNGRAFEHKILSSEKGKTPKFAFLHASSPFHAYYEDRIRFYENGGDDDEEKRREAQKKEEAAREEEEIKAREEAEKKKKRDAKMKASAVDPVARVLLRSRAVIEEARRVAVKADDGTETTNGPVPPPTLRHVSLPAPSNVSPAEIEIIKLTAQYVALSGRADTVHKRDNFLNNLTLREWTNPEFTFLQPRHAHFAYFTALVDGYRTFLPGGQEYEAMKMKGKKDRLESLMTEDTETVEKKKENVVKKCLEAAAYRTEYERDASNRKREALEHAAGGGILGGAGTIDWHDFVVVATIEFDKDEVVEALPAPTSLRMAALNKEVNEKEKEPEEEEEEMEESEEEGSDIEDDEDDGEKLKVVSNYQPKVVSTKEITGDSSRTHIIDPITGKSIAIADMPEHMRIQLLDPKWAEERKRFIEKQRETNFVAGEDISANISRLAQARGDLFGMSQAELDNQNIDSEKRLMEANQLIRNQMQGPALPGAPPPPPPPAAIVPPPPPPPPQPMMAQPSDSLEPAAKRTKIEEPQMNIHPTMMVPPAPPAPPATAIPGLPPPPMPPQFDPNASAAIPPPPQQPTILSEDDFIATLDNPNEIYFCVLIPHDPSNSNWNFHGQTIDVTLTAKSKIKDVKELLKGQLGGMPMNKMQLRHPASGFMNKDGLSLAHYNVGPGMTIDLVPKTRGGRK